MPYEGIPAWKQTALENEKTARERRRKEHVLREFLYELTDACNLFCAHCGSSCERSGNYIDIAEAKKVADDIAEHYGTDEVRLSFTGGEPLLHPGFFDLAAHIRALGFPVGMTTNGTLITLDVARHMADLGIRYITVSLDGMEEHHDIFRGKSGSWKKAVEGMENLIAAGITPSVTTVVNALNIDELDQVKDLLAGMGIKLWRVMNVDPIGRAMEHPELLLDGAGFSKMITYIEDRRINHAGELPETTYSCAHYLGPVHEGETRNWIFSCRSGTTVASVTAKGEFLGCLDVERTPDLVMGHLGQDLFSDVWENRYEPYRISRAVLCTMCQDCEHKDFCDGDSQHTWDYSRNAPKLCIGAH